ncbi:MAG: hypothetical protein ACE5LU_21120 [Anaerolineae bacterium]
MVIKSFIMLMLIFWGLLALWPALRGRLYRPARVPVRGDGQETLPNGRRRPGGDAW